MKKSTFALIEMIVAATIMGLIFGFGVAGLIVGDAAVKLSAFFALVTAGVIGFAFDDFIDAYNELKKDEAKENEDA